MADLIATWAAINSRFGTSGSPTNLCPTRSQVEAWGLYVDSSYAGNQLIPLSAIRALTTNNIAVSITGGDREVAVFATAGYRVTSRVIVTGWFSVETASGDFFDYSFDIAINNGALSGSSSYTTVGGIANLEGINSVSPSSDATYRYEARIL